MKGVIGEAVLSLMGVRNEGLFGDSVFEKAYNVAADC